MKKCLFLTQNPFKSDPEKCLYHIYILFIAYIFFSCKLKISFKEF